MTSTQAVLNPSNTLVGIASPSKHKGAAEKNVAKFIEKAGLSQAVMQDNAFTLAIANPPSPALVVERFDEHLCFTHYIEGNDKQRIQSQLIFTISGRGVLNLNETVIYVNGEEQRGLDRGYARTFSGNLLKQKFLTAAIQSQSVQPQDPEEIEEHPESPSTLPETELASNSPTDVTSSLSEVNRVGISTIPEPSLPDESLSARPELEGPNENLLGVEPPLEPVAMGIEIDTPTESATVQQEQVICTNDVNPESESLIPDQAVGTDSVLEVPNENPPILKSTVDPVVSEVTIDTSRESAMPNQEPVNRTEVNVPGLELSRVAPAQSVQETVIGIERWMKAAQALGKQQNYLLRIEQVSEIVQKGMPLSEQAQAAMSQDLQEYQQTLSQLRSWYKIARDSLGKPPEYLNRIQAIGSSFKDGMPLSSKAVVAMNQDLEVSEEMTAPW